MQKIESLFEKVEVYNHFYAYRVAKIHSHAPKNQSELHYTIGGVFLTVLTLLPNNLETR